MNNRFSSSPPNATHLVQPCDTFIIAMIKKAWSQSLGRKKLEMTQLGDFSNSGKLPNPGKKYFLQLAKQVVQDINRKRNENGDSFARVAMMRCGLGLDDEGQWNIKHLSPEL
ncbi:hypothetical protein GEMRC1_000346 [Eukaryota sp. GEM-RC1]